VGSSRAPSGPGDIADTRDRVQYGAEWTCQHREWKRRLEQVRDLVKERTCSRATGSVGSRALTHCIEHEDLPILVFVEFPRDRELREVDIVVSRHRGLCREYGLEFLFDYCLMSGDAVECRKRSVDIEKGWSVSAAGVTIEERIEQDNRPEEFQGPLDVGNRVPNSPRRHKLGMFAQPQVYCQQQRLLLSCPSRYARRVVLRERDRRFAVTRLLGRGDPNCRSALHSRCPRMSEVRPNFSVGIGEKDRPQRMFAGFSPVDVVTAKKKHQLERGNPKAAVRRHSLLQRRRFETPVTTGR
jgi:hypothetical protein